MWHSPRQHDPDRPGGRASQHNKMIKKEGKIFTTPGPADRRGGGPRAGGPPPGGGGVPSAKTAREAMKEIISGGGRVPDGRKKQLAARAVHCLKRRFGVLVYDCGGGHLPLAWSF